MGISDNFNYVKNELGADGRILENIFRLDRFYKKYKYIIWVVTGTLITAATLLFSYLYYKEKKVAEYSSIYFQLLDDKNNSSLLDKLRTGNSKLYHLFVLSNAINTGNLNELKELSASSDSYVSNVALYYLGSFERDVSSLEKVDGKFMSDFANIQRAYILLQSGKYDDAKAILANVSGDSSLFDLSKLLLNYMVTTK